MEITFYGGAGGVTGSKHLFDTGVGRILFDCGTFQGVGATREKNAVLPFDASTVDHVLLSHAHLDHCGLLPVLVKSGFQGKIYATQATQDIVARMLLDMANIEEQDHVYRAKHHVGDDDDPGWQPLFTREDIEPTMARFVAVPYVRHGQQGKSGTADWFPLSEHLRLKLYDAGHILGSASPVVEVDAVDGDGSGATDSMRLLYTGDVGAKQTPLLFDPQIPTEKIDVVLAESTYGGHSHAAWPDSMDKLEAEIKAAIERKGKIIIPAFSLGRTQGIVYILHKLTDEGRIPRIPIYVDSPLATDLTDIFRDHRDDYDEETYQDFGADDGPLAFRNLNYTQSINESKALNGMRGPFIVISASGMMTAGRVVHHLRHSISDRRNSVFITGYQADGTLGRRLLEGARQVQLHGDWFPVRAKMVVFNEFSAHADREEMTKYLGQLQGVQQIYLVHGEPRQADEFKEALGKKWPDVHVYRPAEGETVQV